MRPTTILLTCGVAAGVLVPALILTDGATRPGYSLWHHGASQLGTGQRGWLQTVNFVIGGLLLLAFAAGLRRVLCRAPQPGRAAIWGPILLAAAGLALAVAGIVPTDPALGYPPGRPEVITATGRVHGLAGLGLFATLAATPFVLARPLRGSNQGWVAYSRWSGALVIAFAIAAGVAFRLDVQGVLRPAPAGLLEHAALLVGFAWIIAAGLRLRSPNTVVQG
ncbi:MULTISPECIES: DUF998 domain-containing protein [unclassified Streptosporangium]|uniref:DUF998 domain-containing protein n=1 Tax=unclassified Streptosporangium TaxID=2632669 RepID=UPI002E2DA16F|nr:MULTISPECIES: DUF998 domain-containing protein [unclassified Streptosporangium]